MAVLQRLMVEMEAMAARPFKPIFLELHPPLGGEGDDASPILHHSNGGAPNSTRPITEVLPHHLPFIIHY
jgi:hypothetical protein